MMNSFDSLWIDSWLRIFGETPKTVLFVNDCAKSIPPNWMYSFFFSVYFTTKFDRQQCKDYCSIVYAAACWNLLKIFVLVCSFLFYFQYIFYTLLFTSTDQVNFSFDIFLSVLFCSFTITFFNWVFWYEREIQWKISIELISEKKTIFFFARVKITWVR